MKTENPLEPCPFCGGIPEVNVYEPCNDYPGNAWFKFAASIGCCVAVHSNEQYQTKEEAISEVEKRWNTRAPSEIRVKPLVFEEVPSRKGITMMRATSALGRYEVYDGGGCFLDNKHLGRASARTIEGAISLAQKDFRDRIVALLEPPGSTENEGWCDLKIAFEAIDDEAIWKAPSDLWPAGWSVSETDASGARLVAVFRVDHLPTAKETRTVANAIDQLERADEDGVFVK